MGSTLKLGTRRSLLAWAQSSWVARSLEAIHPGLKVELIGIDTQGDKILDKPLSQIEGKEFFTAELDLALLRGEVDFSVHSMKDLALDRPEPLTLAASPKRELPHDIMVFHRSVIDRLKAGEEIRVGTSSPRRLTLIPTFLEQALPQFSGRKPKLRFVEIRGNVNTRLGRIHEPASSDRKLDAVVLAFAGLERLAMDTQASLELWKLFENTRFMILPLKECPTAPAQGALAIEARKNAPETIQILKSLHDPVTLTAVEKEREILQEWGGGCHQKLGATFVTLPNSTSLLIRGTKPNGEKVQEIRVLTQNSHELPKESFTRIEASDLFQFKSHSLTSAQKKLLDEAPFLFIAHSRASEFLPQETFDAKRVWVSGTKSWFKLAQRGIWVEGCVEGRGIEALKEFKIKKLMRLESTRTVSLTHSESPETFEVAHIPTYEHELRDELRESCSKVANSDRIFWTSSLPFETIWSTLSTPELKASFLKKTHACGPGTTADALRAKGIEPQIFME